MITANAPVLATILLASSLVLCGFAAVRVTAAVGLGGRIGLLAAAVAYGALLIVSHHVAALVHPSLALADLRRTVLVVIPPAFVAVVLGGPRIRSRLAIRGSAARAWRLVRRGRSGRTVVCLFAATWVLLLFRGAAFPPFGYDALAYHLPLAAAWSNGRMAELPEWFGIGRFPANFSVLQAHGLALGSERWVHLATFASMLVGGLAVYCLTRSAPASRRAAWIAVIVFWSVPMVLLGSIVGYADLFAASMLLASAALLTCRANGGPPAVLWFSGAACGLAVGSKYVALPFALVWVAMAISIEYRRAPQPSARHAVSGGLRFVGAAALGCAYWFVRNWREAGNPLAPIEITVAGRTLFEGQPVHELLPVAKELQYVPSPWHWFVYPWMEFERFGRGFNFESGLGAAFAAFVPVALLVGVLRRVWGDAPSAPSPGRRVVLGLLLAAVAIWAGMTDRQPRYALVAVGLAAALAARQVDFTRGRVGPWLRRVVAVSVACAVVPMAAATVLQIARQVRESVVHGAGRYLLPPEFDRLPADAVIWNGVADTWNYPLLGRAQDHHVIPYRPHSDTIDWDALAQYPPWSLFVFARVTKRGEVPRDPDGHFRLVPLGSSDTGEQTLFRVALAGSGDEAE